MRQRRKKKRKRLSSVLEILLKAKLDLINDYSIYLKVINHTIDKKLKGTGPTTVEQNTYYRISSKEEENSMEMIVKNRN